LLEIGENVFVIRVTNSSGKGGFVPDKPYFMTAEDEEIDLKGTWQYKVGEVYSSSNVAGFGQNSFVHQNQPTALFNAMIAPVLPMKISGFLWYQGVMQSLHEHIMPICLHSLMIGDNIGMITVCHFWWYN
jgi:sialate O-acetylesterase